MQAVDKDDEPSDESRTHCMFVQEQTTVVYGGAGAHPLGPSPTPKPTRSTSLRANKDSSEVTQWLHTWVWH